MSVETSGLNGNTLARNGVTKTGSFVELGGDLIKDTAINLKGFDIAIHDDSNNPFLGDRKGIFYNSDKKSFRTGEATNTQWNDINIGEWSFASGFNCVASGEYSFAAGEGAFATGSRSVAFSGQAINSFDIAIGDSSVANHIGSRAAIAIGNNARSVNFGTTALGSFTIADGSSSTALGFNTIATGVISLAVGSYSRAAGGYSSTIGCFDSVRFVNNTFTSLMMLGSRSDTPTVCIKGGTGSLGTWGGVGIGIGLNEPNNSTILELGAGTTTKAPLLLNVGINTTTPINGAIEFDGVNFYITAQGVRRRIRTQGNFN